uniref:(California timema) hypothetical protein n=1 Tax=Timema californicum TaxID=61474 RepID=A0A7R9JBL1_TIMCA|nr:unnamed protein product [Timema californicum]
MSTDFAPVFEKKFHDRVVPGLLMVLDDNDNPRVQAHAETSDYWHSSDIECPVIRNCTTCPSAELIVFLNTTRKGELKLETNGKY